MSQPHSTAKGFPGPMFPGPMFPGPMSSEPMSSEPMSSEPMLSGPMLSGPMSSKPMSPEDCAWVLPNPKDHHPGIVGLTDDDYCSSSFFNSGGLTLPISHIDQPAEHDYALNDVMIGSPIFQGSTPPETLLAQGIVELSLDNSFTGQWLPDNLNSEPTTPRTPETPSEPDESDFLTFPSLPVALKKPPVWEAGLLAEAPSYELAIPSSVPPSDLFGSYTSYQMLDFYQDSCIPRASFPPLQASSSTIVPDQLKQPFFVVPDMILPAITTHACPSQTMKTKTRPRNKPQSKKWSNGPVPGNNSRVTRTPFVPFNAPEPDGPTQEQVNASTGTKETLNTKGLKGRRITIDIANKPWLHYRPHPIEMDRQIRIVAFVGNKKALLHASESEESTQIPDNKIEQMLKQNEAEANDNDVKTYNAKNVNAKNAHAKGTQSGPEPVRRKRGRPRKRPI